jgi:hypothetical protein
LRAEDLGVGRFIVSTRDDEDDGSEDVACAQHASEVHLPRLAPCP